MTEEIQEEDRKKYGLVILLLLLLIVGLAIGIGYAFTTTVSNDGNDVSHEEYVIDLYTYENGTYTAVEDYAFDKLDVKVAAKTVTNGNGKTVTWIFEPSDKILTDDKTYVKYETKSLNSTGAHTTMKITVHNQDYQNLQVNGFKATVGTYNLTNFVETQTGVDTVFRSTSFDVENGTPLKVTLSCEMSTTAGSYANMAAISSALDNITIDVEFAAEPY